MDHEELLLRFLESLGDPKAVVFVLVFRHNRLTRAQVKKFSGLSEDQLRRALPFLLSKGFLERWTIIQNSKKVSLYVVAKTDMARNTKA